jgi:hypothetical protein
MWTTPAAFCLLAANCCRGLTFPCLREWRAVRRNGAIDLNVADIVDEEFAKKRSGE